MTSTWMLLSFDMQSIRCNASNASMSASLDLQAFCVKLKGDGIDAHLG